MIDIEKLLAEVSAEPPCGLDLEYDPEMQALVEAATGKPGSEMRADASKGERGGVVVPPVPPNWSKVREIAEGLFERTKDTTVAVYLTRALMRTGGIAGLAAGADLLREMFKRYWESAYPRIDSDDPDATLRMNALLPLAHATVGLADLMQTIVVEDRAAGRLSVRDILAAQSRVPLRSDEKPKPQSMIDGMLGAAAKNDPARLTHAHAAIDAVGALQAVLAAKLNDDAAAEMQPLVDALRPVAEVCAKARGAPATAAAGETAAEAAVVPGAVSIVGELRSREDVSRLIDLACEFLERIEPAHPAPLLMRRAQRLLSKSFVDIISDIAPGALGEVKQIAGIKDQ